MTRGERRVDGSAVQSSERRISLEDTCSARRADVVGNGGRSTKRRTDQRPEPASSQQGGASCCSRMEETPIGRWTRTGKMMVHSREADARRAASCAERDKRCAETLELHLDIRLCLHEEQTFKTDNSDLATTHSYALTSLPAIDSYVHSASDLASFNDTFPF